MLVKQIPRGHLKNARGKIRIYFYFYINIVPEIILLSTSYPQKSRKNSQSTNYLLKNICNFVAFIIKFVM